MKVCLLSMLFMGLSVNAVELPKKNELKDKVLKKAAGLIGVENKEKSESSKFKYVALGVANVDWYDSAVASREFQTTQDMYKSITFSMDLSDALQFGGIINIDDETNDIKDYMVQLGMTDYIFRVDYGDINGKVVYDDPNGADASVDKDKTFEGTYKMLSIIKNNDADSEGFVIGGGIAQYEMPADIERGNAGTSKSYAENIQVDDMKYTLAGVGLFKETMIDLQRKIHNGKQVKEHDWYFDTSLLAIGFAIAKMDGLDADETPTNRTLESKSWWGMGQSGTYELGYRYIKKFKNAVVGAKLGYQARSHIYFMYDTFSDPDDEDEDTVVHGGTIHIMHGPKFELSVSF